MLNYFITSLNKKRYLTSAIILSALFYANTILIGELPKIIFDSDMSSDHDDVGDIAILHGLASMGECEIIGMMVSSKNGGTALCMDAINTYYGKPDIPIGVPPDVGGIGEYAGLIAAEYPYDLKDPKDCPLAAKLYRKLLSSSPDKSVTIVTTGYLNNLKSLLESGSDEYSPLNGIELVKKKVKIWVCAGGCFPRGNEFNFRVVPEGAFYTVKHWPTAVMYIGFDIGQAIYTCGRLPELPADNPIRRVYVDIKKLYPYPSWGQIGIYYAVRGSNGLWDAVTVGHNNCDENGTNWWSTDSDPGGDEEQGYLVEKVRTPVRASLDALIMLSPNNGTPSKPGEPTDIRAKINGNNIELSWEDNAYNEKGFKIERGVNGIYKEIARVPANVTSYVDKIPTIKNISYRIKSFNDVGDSIFSYTWIYSGWEEINLTKPGDLPLYSYYQYCNLRWCRGGDFRPEHIVLNNDSEHGKNFAIYVDVGALGAEGAFYVYFFFNDLKNWYRLNVDNKTTKLEKSINGKLIQIATGKGIEIGNGTNLKSWKIEVIPSGQIKFISEGQTILSVTDDKLIFDRGKIGLGGIARTPIWENFHFEILER
ncbi:MAG TPA: hypothetical protein P5239_09430 [Victivallales bacterium]|nr:hypothetical protein [Victivallales bacterium]